MSRWASRIAGGALLCALLFAGCASGPPTPAWQSDARDAIDQAVAAYLAGDSRGEAREFAAARDSVSRTGSPELIARIELMRCAAHVASLDFAPCAGYEAVKRDAAPAEQAYARYLAAQPLPREDLERLPKAQRQVAAAMSGTPPSMRGTPPSLAHVQAIADPLSRLIAIGVSFRAGQASPAMIALASDTASAQGWRRPLLAWLKVQAQLAERAGDAQEAARLQRRIELAQEPAR